MAGLDDYAVRRLLRCDSRGQQQHRGDKSRQQILEHHFHCALLIAWIEVMNFARQYTSVRGGSRFVRFVIPFEAGAEPLRDMVKATTIRDRADARFGRTADDDQGGTTMKKVSLLVLAVFCFQALVFAQSLAPADRDRGVR